MGNQSSLVGCASREEAEAFARRERSRADAPQLDSGKYIIPTFWFAAFGSEDCVFIPGADGAPGFTACIAPSATCVERLRRRRAEILGLLGAHLGDLYDAFIQRLAERFPGTILLNPEEMFWMTSFADADASLRRILAAHEAAEREPGSVDVGALDGFGAVDCGEDDLERPHIFVGWGDDWPPEPPRPPRPEDASITEIRARLADRIRGGLRQCWLDRLPEVALDLLWAEGEHEQVYALARMRDPRKRAETLAWYAALDPAPGRARTVAKEALSRSPLNMETLATVPLGDPELARLARRAAKGHVEQLVLAIRLAGYEPTEPDRASLWGEDRTLIYALAAARAAEQGRRAEAEAALEFAFADHQGTPAALLWAYRAFAACGAWAGSIRLDFGHARATYAAIDEARRAGDEALRRLTEHGAGHIEYILAVALDQDLELEPGGPDAEARLHDCYAEGIITDWELRLGLARMRWQPRPAIRAAMLELLIDARARVQSLADDIASACGARMPDTTHVAGLRATLAAELAKARSAPAPTWSMLTRLGKTCRALAAAGEATTVGAALDSLESAWGPASGWAQKVGGSRTAEWTIAIVASAAGRSQEAAQLVEALGAQTPDLTRACMLVGLARDGDRDAARIGLARLSADSLAPEALPVVAALAVAQDPASAEPLRHAATQEAAGLPDTGAELAAWLTRAH